MDEHNLSPEHIATLLDLAEKVKFRKQHQAKSGAVVKPHDWTPEERRLYAAKNDLRSAQVSYEKTRIAAERAKEAHAHTTATLAKAEARMQSALAVMAVQTDDEI